MIEVEHVTRRYGPVVAVNDVSFSIETGEIVGFLGPNGAGKSTLLKVIATWLPPHAGRVRVGGFDVEREPMGVRQSLGYLPEHNAMYDSMRVDRFLRFMGRVRGLSGAELKDRLEWVVDRCELTAVIGKAVNQCSKGYRQRVGLAAALIHDPPVIVLDEPTHGLDPVQVAAFRRFLHSLAEGRTILFSSHILAEVTAICRRLLVIGEGRLLADSPLEDLRRLAVKDGIDLEEAVLRIVRPARRAS